MEPIKLAGIIKEYDRTYTTFIKKGMWPERFNAELRGLNLVSQVGVSIPKVLKAELSEFGGMIVYQRVYNPRLDQVFWGNPNPELMKKVGNTLARIHQINHQEQASIRLPQRRFQDLVRDVFSQGSIPFRIADYNTKLFHLVCNKMLSHNPCLLHGDYTLQNMFYGDNIMVFDWEHSCFGSPLYDLGCLASFLMLLVTDGGWSLFDYYQAIDCLQEGYQENSNYKIDKIQFEVLRFLGHRQVPQYYLLSLEYLAMVEGNAAAQNILSGSLDGPLADKVLRGMGLNFNQLWLGKILQSLKKGDYRCASSLWDWSKKENLL